LADRAGRRQEGQTVEGKPRLEQTPGGLATGRRLRKMLSEPSSNNSYRHAEKLRCSAWNI
jgi:hypothetical protein